MWYLQDRAQAAIRDNKPVAGTPFSARARTTGRLFPGKLAPPQAPYDTQVLKASGSPAVQAGLSRAQPVEQVVDQPGESAAAAATSATESYRAATKAAIHIQVCVLASQVLYWSFDSGCPHSHAAALPSLLQRH
jgi:hypothetical protein